MKDLPTCMSTTTQYMIWNKILLIIPYSIATDTVDIWVVIGNVRYLLHKN